jgi:hypothetical protein
MSVTNPCVVVTYFMPSLIPEDEPQYGANREVNAVSEAWFQQALTRPFLFHALVFNGIVYLDFVRYGHIFPNSPRALHHKLIVISKLNEMMANGAGILRDDILLAVLILACNENRDEDDERRSPFNSPLQNLQLHNFYGNTKGVSEHGQAIVKILQLGGGLETLQLPGLIDPFSV